MLAVEICVEYFNFHPRKTPGLRLLRLDIVNSSRMTLLLNADVFERGGIGKFVNGEPNRKKWSNAKTGDD